MARGVLVGAAALVVGLHPGGHLSAARDGGYDPDASTVSLHALLGGSATRPEHGIAIYKSTGSGFQDIVLAELLYDRAVAQGLGTPLPVGILSIPK